MVASSSHAKMSLALISMGLIVSGCGGGSGSSIAAPSTVMASRQWTGETLQTIRDRALGPTVTSRLLALVHTAAFDAWSCYDSVAVSTRLGGIHRRPLSERTTANKEKAISYAMYRMLVNIVPAEKPDFDARMIAQGYDPNNTSTDWTTPEGIGNNMAAALIAYRATDGSNQANAYADTTGYTTPNSATTIIDPNKWQPQTFILPGGITRTPGFLTPQWGQITPFSLPSGDYFRPGPPAVYPSTAFTQQALDLIDIQVNLTDRQKMIAEYWANGPSTETPPGHWFLFQQVVSERDNFSIDQDVKSKFLLGNAVLDAGIACWETKRFYNNSRPITAIRFLFRDQTIQGWKGNRQVGSILGQNWKPFQPDSFITPPFAEYSSGHSTFSAASAEILKRFTGSDSFGHSVTIAIGTSLAEPAITPATPITLSWPTFSDAADEAGWSRRYGGIHFEDGDLRARNMGRLIGDLVWNKGQEYINGTAFTP